MIDRAIGSDVTPKEVPLGERMRNRKLGNIRTSGPFNRRCPLGCSLGRPRLSFSIPGYLPLPHHFISAFNNGFHLRCFRICCVRSFNSRLYLDISSIPYLKCIYLLFNDIKEYYCLREI
jgi:hypothetical protein